MPPQLPIQCHGGTEQKKKKLLPLSKKKGCNFGFDQGQTILHPYH
jgi:hypothetical protein